MTLPAPATTEAAAERRALTLPDHMVAPERPSPPRSLGGWLAAGLTAVGVALFGLFLLVASVFVAAGAGFWEVVCQVRETAVRPRPFVGADHGFPFLDPAPVVVAEDGAQGADEVNPYTD